MVVVQLVLGKRPEPLNTIEVVLALVSERLGMVQSVVFSPALERVVTLEGIGVVDRPLSCFLPDDVEECLSRDIRYHSGIDPAIAL